MHIDFLTLFPEMFGYLDMSILKRAQAAGVVTFGVHDMREQATNKHRTVDDRPFGGGVGMVLKPDIVKKALDAIQPPPHARVLVTTPQGRVFDQAFAKELASAEHLVFLCGHYEAFDERVHDQLVTDEVSIGDYVLTGGELPALVMTDAIVRLRPGAVGKEASAHEDSFYHGLLDYPHYTRPAEFEGWDVPAVLMGGHHKEVESWRRQEALKRTYLRRPDLLAIANLTNQDRAYLAKLERDLAQKGRG